MVQRAHKIFKYATFQISMSFVEREKIIYDSFFLKRNIYEFSELFAKSTTAQYLVYIWLSHMTPSKKHIQYIS